MADQHHHGEHEGGDAVHPEGLGEPEPLSKVVRDVTHGIAEFLEGEPLVGDEEDRDDGEGPLSGEQLAP